MSFIIIEGERYALSLGETVLGGSDDELLASSPLASRPPFAIVSASPEGTATIRRYQGGPSSLIDGHPLTEQPVELEHGARIEMPGTRIVYGHLRSSGKTAHEVATHEDVSEGAIGDVVQQPTASSGGRLTALHDGVAYDIAPGGLTIGRDPACDVVIDHSKVSRLHARIDTTLLGYSLTDSSTNGVFVNGRRIDESHRLSQGDVVRVGDAEFRFEADNASFEPDVSGVRPVPVMPAVVPKPPRTSQPVAPPAVEKRATERAPLLATLEVLTEGNLKGKRFRIERPVAHLGRGDYNDVEVPEESVSASHAMLMRREDGWRITDLGSRNGTYVDGERTNEIALQGAAEIRLGNLRLLFRPIAPTSARPDSTRGIVSITDDALEIQNQRVEEKKRRK